ACGEALGFEVAQRPIVDDSIGGREEPGEKFLARRGAEIQRDAALAGVEVEVEGTGFSGRNSIGERPEVAQPATARRLDFYDVGTEISEQLRAEAAGDAGGEVDDTRPFESRHGSPPRLGLPPRRCG